MISKRELSPEKDDDKISAKDETKKAKISESIHSDEEPKLFVEKYKETPITEAKSAQPENEDTFSDPEELNLPPVTADDALKMQKHAREIGSIEFIKHHLSLGTPIRKLIYAFDFDIPLSLWDADDEVLWSLFARLLRRFCMKRYKLPHINTLDDAVKLIGNSKKILVLTGAGISVSCGIPDFRSENGLYSIISEKYPDLDDPQLMFDIHYFKHNPKPFFELAKEIFPSNFSPSNTHMFIKHLEEKGTLLRNYTQNIDTLEKISEISKVVHCHGSFDQATCQVCRDKVDGNYIRDKIMASEIPYCDKCSNNGFLKEGLSADDENTPQPILKPDIVFFGENLPDEFDRLIEQDREEADLMIVIGSSLKVAPVADLVGYIPHHVPLILINREPVFHLHHSIDIHLLGYCDQIVEELSRRLGWDVPLKKKSDSETPIEAQHVSPNLYLFPGASFDVDKYEKFIRNECTASDFDTSTSASSSSEEYSSDEETPKEVPHVHVPFDIHQAEYPSTDEEDEDFKT